MDQIKDQTMGRIKVQCKDQITDPIKDKTMGRTKVQCKD